MYDPTIGQFISEDPIGFKAGDPNLRRYVGNHPTYATDPDGLEENPTTTPTTPPYWNGASDGQRIWKSERELYPNDPPYIRGRDYVRGFPADLIDPFPRARIGTKPPAYQCYTYDDTDVRMMHSVVARADIRANLMHFKISIVNEVAKILPAGFSPGEKERVSNVVADWYIRTVDEFLRTHYGARPELGMRNRLADAIGLQDEVNNPWCADWAKYMLGAADEMIDTPVTFAGQEKRLGGILRFKGLQYRSYWYQHNFIGIYPDDGKYVSPPSRRPGLLIFDPWIRIRPDVYPVNKHPTPPNSEGLK